MRPSQHAMASRLRLAGTSELRMSATVSDRGDSIAMRLASVSTSGCFRLLHRQSHNLAKTQELQLRDTKHSQPATRL